MSVVVAAAAAVDEVVDIIADAVAFQQEWLSFSAVTKKFCTNFCFFGNLCFHDLINDFWVSCILISGFSLLISLFRKKKFLIVS